LLIRCFLGECQLPYVEVRKHTSQYMWEFQKINTDENASTIEKIVILPKNQRHI